MSSTVPKPLRMLISVCQHIKNVVLVQNAVHRRSITANATIELHAANGRQVVAIRVEEQVLEQVLSRFFGRRLTWTHHAVDFDQRFEARR